VAHKLLHKAAIGLRTKGLWAATSGCAIGFAVPRRKTRPPGAALAGGKKRWQRIEPPSAHGQPTKGEDPRLRSGSRFGRATRGWKARAAPERMPDNHTLIARSAACGPAGQRAPASTTLIYWRASGRVGPTPCTRSPV